MVVFVVLNPGGSYSCRIAEAVRRNGRRAALLSWRNFDQAAIGRLDPRRDIIFFRTGAPPAVRIARAFEDAGFEVLNDSRYIQLSSHKYLANVHAEANGIAVPDLNARVSKDNTELLALHLAQYGPLVVKPLVSRDMGRYVYLVRTVRDLSQVAAIPGSHVLVQSEVSFSRLVRTVATCDGMLAEATTYDTKHDSWKATVCSNPRARQYREIPQELTETVTKTIRVFGGDIAYIDYFETTRGFVLSEINHSCDLTAQEQITGHPIAQELGAFLAAAEEQIAQC